MDIEEFFEFNFDKEFFKIWFAISLISVCICLLFVKLSESSEFTKLIVVIVCGIIAMPVTLIILTILCWMLMRSSFRDKKNRKKKK